MMSSTKLPILPAALVITFSGTAIAAMYDGTYHGTLTGDSGNAPVCAKQASVQMTVADGKVDYNHMGHAKIIASVGADGSFSGSAQNVYSVSRTGPQVQTLDGKIAGGAIQAQTKVGGCSYRLELKKYN